MMNMKEWKWRSGEDWSYSNWAEGEPGDGDGDDDDDGDGDCDHI